MKNDQRIRDNFDRFTFASIVADAKACKRPANYNLDMEGGDFDDYFTADDYDRRQYQRDARDYRY